MQAVQSYKALIQSFLVKFTNHDGEKPVKLYFDRFLHDKIKQETYLTKTRGPMGTTDGFLCGLPYKVHDGDWGELTVEGEEGTVRFQFFNS